MKRLVATRVVLGAVFALLGGVYFGVAPAHADASLSNWHKGILVQPTYTTDFSSSNFQQSMRNAAADGVNDVTLVVPLLQSNIYSTDIQTYNSTPTDQSLASAINFVHSLGMQATVSVHDDPNDGNWRALINPSDRTTWFANYGSYLNHYADIAQANGAQELVIGTEMSSMTIPSYNSTNTQNWVNMIQSARGHFGGLMTYGAEHGGYMSDDTSLGFWGNLDEIGISAYYSMGSNNASVSDMENTWSQIDNNEIRGLAQGYGKPVNFIEVGYVSGNNGLSDPGSGYENPGGYNAQLQANAYQALLAYWSNSSYVKGVSFWQWSTNPNAGGNGDQDYTPQNKPAEQVMKQWFTAGGTPASVTAPAAPATPAQPSTYSISNVSSNVTSTTANTPITASVSASSTQASSNDIVDVEIYDQNGNRIAQKFYENQNLSSSPTAYQINWTPSQAGSYKLEAGIFTANWQSNLTWNGLLTTISVTSGQPAQVPAQPTTSAPTTSGPAPSQPAAPAAPATGANVDIWWPSNGSSVTGVQPFKALIDGVDQNSYSMFWQVDGGQLNAMSNNNTDGSHKEADVDVSSWNWQSSGQYVITFVAKDSNGNTVASKSTTITILH